MNQTTKADAQHKVVLVTGASSGIGRAIAAHLASRGHRVFGTSRKAGVSGEAGVEMIAIDVDDDRSVAEGVALVMEKAGRLDALVNNAGSAIMGAVEDTSLDEAKWQMETNFFGVLRLCRAVLPHMRRQGHGYIVNISSLSGLFGTPFSGLYSASKFAVEGLTETLRYETRRFGVRAVLVEPGDHASQLAATRRIARAALGDSAYREAFTKFKANQEKDEAKAPGPRAVAVLVERILADPRPRPRYSVGMAGQRIVVPLKRFLPAKVFEWVIGRALGI